jgi:hypothetical protein
MGELSFSGELCGASLGSYQSESSLGDLLVALFGVRTAHTYPDINSGLAYILAPMRPILSITETRLRPELLIMRLRIRLIVGRRFCRRGMCAAAGMIEPFIA